MRFGPRTIGDFRETAAMNIRSWLVGLGALFVAGLALYVLTVGKPPASSERPAEPVMDEIDDESREAMREFLRESESQ